MTSKFLLRMSALLLALAWGRVRAADDQMDVFRLPGSTRPLSYDLRIVPHMNGSESTFSGVVKIEFTASENTNAITLNLKDLNVIDVSVMDVAGAEPKKLNVSLWTYVAKNEQLVIRLERSVIPKRKCIATISYEGKIRDDLTGFYLSSYVESDVTKWLAVTQFEPTYARRAFPCYDEPSYKAIFSVSVVKEKNQLALSNMPIKKVQNETISSNNTEVEVVYFESTPSMSSYLLAFYIGEFVPNPKNSSVTIYTHSDYVNQTKYSAEEAPRHLKAMQDYTGIPCSINKLDLLAIPDFAAGAMENWGINTFQEYYLLLHSESKTKMYMRSSIVMQHEFTHQWFGNQVTCEWWDYLWLNEGFARYFQYFATGTVRTKWQMEEMFVVEAHQNSLAYDQTPRHPITASVNTISEIENVFDTISYSKAASVIRMLRYLVSEEVFKLSLHNYLETHMYGVTVPNNLFAEFDSVLFEDKEHSFKNELTVYEFMSNWTTQAGYPVLNITRNENTNTYSIFQSRFLVNDADKNLNESQVWHIGLTFTTDQNKNFSHFEPSAWTNKTSNPTVIPAQAKSEWYIFNIQSTGFYRVNYDIKNWMALIKQLNIDNSAIHVLNRAQLIDDSFALALAGHSDYSVPLRLSKYLKNETSVIPFYSAIRGFSYLEERMPRHESGYEKFKTYVSKLAGSIYKRLETLVSNGNSEYSVTSAWETFSTWACRLDNEDCTTKALQYFKKWQAGEKISADIKDVAFCIGVKNSTGNGIFNRIFELYKTTSSISEKTSALWALGCSTNRTQLTEYLNHIFDGSNGPVKKKDYFAIISAVSKTPLGRDVIHEFLSTNLNNTLTGVPDGESIVTHMYSVLTSKIATDSEIEKAKYLKDNSTLTASVKASFDKSFEKVNHNLLWFNKYGESVGQWAIKNEDEEKKEEGTTQAPTTPPSKTTQKPTTLAASTVSPISTPKPSGASSNRHCNIITLQLTVVAILIKTHF